MWYARSTPDTTATSTTWSANTFPAQDLRRYVRERGPLGMVEAATIVSQAAKALDYAHQSGLIHRDVKPGNVLVHREGIAKVSDLGLAGWLHDENDPRANRIVGTADYLSPEQILTPSAVTGQSDVYSLGCTLYYAVTGKVPFPGGTTRDKARRHCEDSPIHPRVLNPALSERFVGVLAAMMAKKPAERLKSMAEVVERLSPWSAAHDQAPPGDSAEWRVDEIGLNVLDASQDTEPSDSNLGLALNGPRTVPPRVVPAPAPVATGAWTIPENPDAIPGSQSLSQSQANLLPEEPVIVIKTQWLIAGLLGLIALLAIGLVVSIVIQAVTMQR
ncbi:MAG: serine/threonine-protein kinase [Pirellulales bacterium]